MATAPTTGEAPHPTSGSGDDRWARITGFTRRSARAVGQTAWSALRSAGKALPSARAALQWRRVRLIDVLRVLGLARRAVPRPVAGPKAYPQWWQRIVALLVLAALVVVIGFALAALVGLLVVVAGFLLEQAIS